MEQVFSDNTLSCVHFSGSLNITTVQHEACTAILTIIHFLKLADLGDIRHACIHRHCMACLHSPNLGAVYIIPESLSFWNEFRSRVKFVRRCRLPYFRVRSDTHACSTRPRLWDEVLFQFTSWYQNEISYQKGPGISFGMKTGMNSSRNNLFKNEKSFWYHVNKYRETYIWSSRMNDVPVSVPGE